MFIPSVTASNPYQDFAHNNGLDYGDVLNYVGILDNEKLTVWHEKAFKNLPIEYRREIKILKDNLRKHYYGIAN